MSNHIHTTETKKQVTVFNQEDPIVEKYLKLLEVRNTLYIKFEKTKNSLQVNKNSISKLIKYSHNKNIQDMLDYITFRSIETRSEMVEKFHKIEKRGHLDTNLKYELKQTDDRLSYNGNITVKSQTEISSSEQKQSERKNSQPGKDADQKAEGSSPVRRSKTLTKLLAGRQEVQNTNINGSGIITKSFKENDTKGIQIDPSSLNLNQLKSSGIRRLSAKTITIKPGSIIKKTHEEEVSEEEEEEVETRSEVKKMSLKIGGTEKFTNMSKLF
jgi:hypothetical protein